MIDSGGNWLTILEYANIKKLSISTVRRYIKAKRVRYELQSGKYLIWCSKEILDKQAKDENQKLILIINELEEKNLKLTESLEDMQCLLKVYEEKNFFSKQKTDSFLPALPTELEQ